MSQSSKRVKGEAPTELNQDPVRLRRRRIAAGLTLREAGEKANCSFTHLQALERGGHSANVTTLAKLAAAYDCTISDLMSPKVNGKAA